MAKESGYDVFSNLGSIAPKSLFTSSLVPQYDDNGTIVGYGQQQTFAVPGAQAVGVDENNPTPSGYQVPVGNIGSEPILANYDVNGNLTGYESRQFGVDGKNYAGNWDASGVAAPSEIKPHQGSFVNDFLNNDLGKVAAIAALYYGGPAALDALSSGAASSAPEAIASVQDFSGALPAGSAYVAPEVTPLSQVASTEAGIGLTAPEAAAGAGVAQGLTGSSTALGDIGGGVASETGSLIPDYAVPAAAGAAAGAAGAGSSLASMLPYMAGAGVVSGLLGANAAQKGAETQANAATNAANIQQQNLATINAQQAPQRALGYTGGINQLGALGSGTYQTYDASGNPTGTSQGSGYLTHQFNAQDLAAGLAPNYDFMLQQGQMANQRAGNVGGGALSGNTLQGLQKYTQDYAGNAYQNAFTNYQNQRNNIYNTLAGIAGIGQTGQTATNTAATNATNAATQLGVGSAAAQAAGGTGAANAYSNALNNVTNNYTLASLLNQRGNVTSPNP
jgi:hypothetical protein